MTPIQWARFNPEERELVRQIIDRAYHLFHSVGGHRTRMDIEMSLSAVHARTPLRLADLLAAPDFDFAHDIGGIARHINRETGELEDCFVPRFVAPENGS